MPAGDIAAVTCRVPTWELPLAHPTAHLPHPAPGAAAPALLEVLCLLQGECLSWLPQPRERTRYGQNDDKFPEFTQPPAWPGSQGMAS